MDWKKKGRYLLTRLKNRKMMIFLIKVKVNSKERISMRESLTKLDHKKLKKLLECNILILKHVTYMLLSSESATITIGSVHILFVENVI